MNAILELVLRPVVAFCLRRSIKIQDVLDALKVVFIRLAEEEMKRSNVEQSISKLSAMTGIPRREVGRHLGKRAVAAPTENFIRRVIGQWRHDPRFSNGGRPRVLESGVKESEFSELVKSVGRDLNPYTVLFELERLGYVERTKTGLRLHAKLHVVRGDDEESFRLLSSDLDDLISAVEENTLSEPKELNLHLKTQFDNVVVDALPELRRWLRTEGSKFQEKVRNKLSKFDKDLNSALAGKRGGARIALGTFSFTELPRMTDMEDTL